MGAVSTRRRGRVVGTRRDGCGEAARGSACARMRSGPFVAIVMRAGRATGGAMRARPDHTRRSPTIRARHIPLAAAALLAGVAVAGTSPAAPDTLGTPGTSATLALRAGRSLGDRDGRVDRPRSARHLPGEGRPDRCGVRPGRGILAPAPGGHDARGPAGRRRPRRLDRQGDARMGRIPAGRLQARDESLAAAARNPGRTRAARGGRLDRDPDARMGRRLLRRQHRRRCRLPTKNQQLAQAARRAARRPAVGDERVDGQGSS